MGGRHVDVSVTGTNSATINVFSTRSSHLRSSTISCELDEIVRCWRRKIMEHRDGRSTAALPAWLVKRNWRLCMDYGAAGISKFGQRYNACPRAWFIREHAAAALVEKLSGTGMERQARFRW